VYERIKEPILVTARFTSKGPRPQTFIWKNREYIINQTNFIHQSKEGDNLLTHFSVTCGNEGYKITFNSNKLTWTLDEIYTEGFLRGNTVHEGKVTYRTRGREV
jgi:hypothetical protein